jgi:hypothetical protein
MLVSVNCDPGAYHPYWHSNFQQQDTVPYVGNTVSLPLRLSPTITRHCLVAVISKRDYLHAISEILCCSSSSIWTGTARSASRMPARVQ